MAGYVPSSSLPGTGRSLATVDPPAKHIASNSSRNCSAVMSIPTFTDV